MTGSNIALLFGAMLVLSIVPGPSDFAVAARSASAGIAQGALMIAGIVAADALFIVFAAHSLAAIADAAGAFFLILKRICGVFLIALAVRSLGARPGQAERPHSKAASSASSFLAGLLITLGDPKAILFYMGFLPAFVDLTRLTVRDTLVIIGIAAVAIGGVKGAYAYLADRARVLFDNAAARKRLNWAAAATLAAAGAFLLLQR